jgi:transposase-like protein
MLLCGVTESKRLQLQRMFLVESATSHNFFEMKVGTETVRRVSYSLLEKGRMAVEAYSTEKNIRATAKKYNVQPQQIRKWKSKKLDATYIEYVEEQNNNNKRRLLEGTAAERANALLDSDEEDDDNNSFQLQKVDQEQRAARKRQKTAHRDTGGGRKSKFPTEINNALKFFFDTFRENDFTVDIRLMMAQAKSLDPEGCATISDTALRFRVYRLMKSWNVSWRKGTHKAQNTRHTAKKMREFHRYIRNKIKMLDIDESQVYNFDETDVQFTPHLNSTYCYKGSRTVTQKEPKCSSRCTAMIGCSMDGRKAPPFIIFLGADTKDGIIKKKVRAKTGFPESMEYQVQKNAWMDEVGMLEWVERVWKPIAQQHSRTLLLMDSFSAHLTTKVSRALAMVNTELEIIPGGYTSKLQPMDVGVNKPFKNYICNNYIDWMKDNGNAKPTREIVAKWISEAWDRLTPTICTNSFRGAGYLGEVRSRENIPAAENCDDDINSTSTIGANEEDEVVLGGADNGANTEEERDDEGGDDLELL